MMNRAELQQLAHQHGWQRDTTIDATHPHYDAYRRGRQRVSLRWNGSRLDYVEFGSRASATGYTITGANPAAFIEMMRDVLASPPDDTTA
mgnify:CR=1 FL=1